MKVINYLMKEKYAVFSLMLTLLCVFLGGGVLMADATVVAGGTPDATPGVAGLQTQVAGAATTVSNAVEAGGDGGEGLIQPDIDDDIFLIGTDETVLDGIMRKGVSPTFTANVTLRL